MPSVFAISRSLLVVSALLAAVLRTSAARAEDAPKPADASRAAAQALFEAGRELMQAGLFGEACPKLQKSVELEDAPGTRLNLAWCHEQLGQTASAWVNYQDALAIAVQRGDVERQALARERLSALAPKLSRVKVALPAPRPAGAWLSVDGVALGVESFETSFPVDPGEHRLRAGAPGFLEVELAIRVKAGEPLQAVTLPGLRRPRRVAARQQSAPWLSEQTRYLLTGSSIGVGVAGLVGAGVFGWKAKQAWDERNAACRGGCGAEAVAAGDNAETFAWVANASLGIGLLGAGIGSYMLWSAPRASGVTVGVAASDRAALLSASGEL